MSRDKLLPDEVRASVVEALYAQAAARNWEALPPRDRTRAYTGWLEAPEIGMVLSSYMTPEQIRSWIKDGPMKEYSRALRGQGRFAAYGRQGGTGPVDVIKHALGDGASILDGSLGTKPLHCRARQDGVTSYLAWGDGSNFRNLLWAALRASLEGGLPGHIVVLSPPTRSTPREDVIRHRRFAERCGLHVHHMREVPGT